MTKKRQCRHCFQRPANRPRQLCWSCFYRPGVRERYPVKSKFGQRGVGAYVQPGQRPLPAYWTDFPPGHPCKVEVLCERAARLEELWHPLDATSFSAAACTQDIEALLEQLNCGGT